MTVNEFEMAWSSFYRKHITMGNLELEKRLLIYYIFWIFVARFIEQFGTIPGQPRAEIQNQKIGGQAEKCLKVLFNKIKYYTGDDFTKTRGYS